MECCKLRTLSYISTCLQLMICILLSVGLTIACFTIDWNYLTEEGLDTTFIICIAIGFISMPFCLLLLAGIRQNRATLVGVFLYMAHAVFAISIICMVYEFIMGFVHKRAVSHIFLHLVIESLGIGIAFLLTTPIELLHKKMQPSFEEPSTTQSVRKPN